MPPDPLGPPVGTPPPEPLDDMDLFALVDPEARKAGVPTDLILHQIRQESRGNPHAVSPKGAQGLMQLMPATALAYGVKDPFDPVANIRAGVTHMAKLLKQYKGDQRMAKLDYNGGPAAVQAFQSGHPFKESLQYLAGTGDEQVGAPPPAPADDLDAFTQQFQSAESEAPPKPQLGAPPPKPGAIPDPRGLPGGAPMGLVRRGLTHAAIGTAEALDPTTPTGRRNLVAGAGAAAVVGSGGLAGMGVVPAALLTAGGAGVAGGLAESGEQAAGTKPTSDAEVARAAREQAAYELLGQSIGIPAAAIGKRMIASRVGRYATEALSSAKQATLDRLGTALEAAQGTLRNVKEATTRTVENVRQGAKEHVAGMTSAAGQMVNQAKQALEPLEAGEFGPYSQMVNQPPPSPTAAGQAVSETMRGPAKSARDKLGQAVEDAAAKGPGVNIAALKAEAQKVVEEQLRPVAQHFPGAGKEMPEGMRGISLSDLAPAAQERLDPHTKAVLAAAAEAQVDARLKHPIMPVLHQILSAEDEVPFAAAHQFKRQLDDALLGSWDKVERKRVANLTMKMRSSLRDAMTATGHTAYEEATAAYQKAVPLFTKGFAPQIRKLAIDNPERIVGMIKASEPTKMSMLRETLTTMAEQGGGGEQGHQAWQSVLNAWTHDNLTKGGLDGLGKRLEKVSPEFEEAMGPEGKSILDNLRQIQTAYTDAVSSGRLKLEAAEAGKASAVAQGRQEGAEAITQARRTGRAQVGAATQDVKQAQKAVSVAKQPTDEETRLLASSVGPRNTHSPEQIGADVARSIFLAPHGSIWGYVSLGRLLRGPKSKDLLEWAKYSPMGTRMLVKAFTSPEPGVALADVFRILGTRKPPAPNAQVGAPPPAP